MNLLSIWLIAKDNRADDRIDFERGEHATETMRVKYSPGESASRTTYTFVLSRSGVRRYLGNMFQSLQLDQDPWEKVQISPATGPSIIYHVGDLETAEEVIMDTIDSLLYTDVERS
uniref:Uncharacterized protein n=1 Tax=viral metagenome TaxID=1070528 RepID=A0A6C0F487_9ZZZZ